MVKKRFSSTASENVIWKPVDSIFCLISLENQIYLVVPVLECWWWWLSCGVVSIYSHGEIIVSGVESQRYFYIVYIPTCFPTVSFLDGRMDGRTGGWNLDGYEIDSNARVSQFSFSFSLSYFSITFLFFLEEDCFLYFFIFFFFWGGEEEVTNSSFWSNVCLCQCLCIYENRKEKKSNFLISFLELPRWKSRRIIEIRPPSSSYPNIQNTIDTYTSRWQTSPNAYT